MCTEPKPIADNCGRAPDGSADFETPDDRTAFALETEESARLIAAGPFSSDIKVVTDDRGASENTPGEIRSPQQPSVISRQCVQVMIV